MNELMNRKPHLIGLWPAQPELSIFQEETEEPQAIINLLDVVETSIWENHRWIGIWMF